ncbi:hypothetical protein Tco_1104671 [Tanacetum coccineum]
MFRWGWGDVQHGWSWVRLGAPQINRCRCPRFPVGVWGARVRREALMVLGGGLMLASSAVRWGGVAVRDRPPMLAMGRYAQWRSHFLRYIDTRPNGDALKKCILEGPYTPSTVIIPTVPTTENYPAVPE